LKASPRDSCPPLVHKSAGQPGVDSHVTLASAVGAHQRRPSCLRVRYEVKSRLMRAHPLTDGEIMNHFTPESVLETLGSVAIQFLYDAESHRPVLQVMKSHGANGPVTLRYAFAPNASIPSWLLTDVLSTLDVAITDFCRHLFGIQEELELRGPQVYPPSQGG
jgi:hypothetical protein